MIRDADIEDLAAEAAGNFWDTVTKKYPALEQYVEDRYAPITEFYEQCEKIIRELVEVGTNEYDVTLIRVTRVNTRVRGFDEDDVTDMFDVPHPEDLEGELDFEWEDDEWSVDTIAEL